MHNEDEACFGPGYANGPLERFVLGARISAQGINRPRGEALNSAFPSRAARRERLFERRGFPRTLQMFVMLIVDLYYVALPEDLGLVFFPSLLN